MMNRMIAFLLIMTMSFLMIQPVLAESEQEPQDTSFLSRVGEWLSGAAEDVKEATSAVGEWTREQWASVKEKATALIGQASGTAKIFLQWLVDNWDYLTSNNTFFRWLKTIWSNLSSILEKLPEELPERINQLLKIKRTYEGVMELMEFLAAL